MKDRLFRERGNAIGHGLNDAFTFTRDLQTLKAQIVSPMVRRLDGCKQLDPLTILDIRVFHRRKAANSKDGDINRRRLVFEMEEIGAIAGRAGRQFIRIQRLDVTDGSRQDDLL